MERGFVRRMACMTLDQASSIGFRSGEYRGGECREALEELAGHASGAGSTAREAEPIAQGGPTAPEPGLEREVSLDPDRLAVVGVTGEQQAIQVRWMTSGALVSSVDGFLRMTLGAPISAAEDLAARTGSPAAGAGPRSSLATVRRVEVARRRHRP